MDVLNMQNANKVVKLLKRNFNGINESVTATKGQVDFEISKPYGYGNHTLNVFVDGAYAYEVLDYTEVDATHIKFRKPLDEGQVVLFKTNVVGIPTYNVPPFDDKDLRKLITDNTDSINKIISLLDDDKDGDILDLIVNIKSQWDNADGELTKLIANKADTSIVNSNIDTMKEELTKTIVDIDKVVTEVSKAVIELKEYNTKNTDTADISKVKQSVDELTSSVAKITEDAKVINDKMIADMKVISDELAKPKEETKLVDGVTGLKYIFEINDGIITPKLVSTDKEYIDYIATQLDLSVQSIDWTNITSDLKAPKTIKNTSVVWSTSDNVIADIIDNGTDITIKVTRPETADGNKNVVLTATIKINSETITKKFNAVVLCK